MPVLPARTVPFFLLFSLETERVAEIHGMSRSRCEAFGDTGGWFGNLPAALVLFFQPQPAAAQASNQGLAFSELGDYVQEA
jgi:hypothetical protein